MKYKNVTKLKAKINPTVDSNTANYFHKKFFVQENKMAFNKIGQPNHDIIRQPDPHGLNCKFCSSRCPLSSKRERFL